MGTASLLARASLLGSGSREVRLKQEEGCHLCGSDQVHGLPEFAQLERVTSDCKPWPRGGTLRVCARCGTLQKQTDEAWRADCQKIYANYTIYHGSDGEEQPVFMPGRGLVARSRCLLEHLAKAVTLPARGRELDVGCGNGGLLRSFGQLFPEWAAVGTEFNDKYVERVESLPTVEKVYTGPLGEVPGSFDLTTLLHVLEHVEGPAALLGELRQKLSPTGLLVLEFPAFELNAFDLVIADHCTHFTDLSVRSLLAQAGYAVELTTTAWVPKERIVVARPLARGAGETAAGAPQETLAAARQAVGFLVEVKERSLARRKACARLGVFGTSIAATWLYGVLGGEVDFWVDEDAQRVGRDYMGRPVYRPDQAPADSEVLVALAPTLATRLRAQCEAVNPSVRWLEPVGSSS